jgi:hypothetical protein
LTRRAGDHYPTPAWCVERLVEAVELPGRWWLEPAAGEGAIIRALRPHAPPDVMWTAIDIRQDFHPQLGELGACPLVASFPAWSVTRAAELAAAPGSPRGYDLVITNPPFSLAEDFIRAALRLAPTVIMLLPLSYLASAEREPLWREWTPDLYVLPDRPIFVGASSAHADYAWFVWRGRRTRAGRVRVLRTTPRAQRVPGLAPAMLQQELLR